MWHGCNWHHVKAHSGCPWNECVDVAANAATQEGSSLPTFSDLWREILNDEADQVALGWVWYLERMQWCPSKEVHVSQTGMTVKLPANHIEDLDTRLAMDACWKTVKDVQPALRKRVEITAATANVLSLFAGKDDKLAKGQYISARMEALQLQFAEANIDLWGCKKRGTRRNTTSNVTAITYSLVRLLPRVMVGYSFGSPNNYIVACVSLKST